MKKVPDPGCEVDYWHKLDPEAKKWLNQFNSEFHNGYYSKKKKPIHGKRQRRRLEHDRYYRRQDAYRKAKPSLVQPEEISRPPRLEEQIDSRRELAKLLNSDRKLAS